MKAFDRWTVLAHGPLERLEENLWRVEGALPGEATMRRVMTLVRLGDGRLVVHNAIALEEPLMREIEAWGRPAFLIVPNGWHRLDARVWKERYPASVVACPAGARRKVEQVVRVDATAPLDLGDDESARYEAVDGTREAEGVLVVRSAGGATVVVNDLLANMPDTPGLAGLPYRLLGSVGPPPRVPRVARWFIIKDRRAARAHLERLAGTPGLARLVMSHGEVVTGGAARALRDAAAAL